MTFEGGDIFDIRYIAELAGEKTARLLVETFPGVSLYIPARKLPEGHVLLTLGEEVAQTVQDHFGGAHLDIPRRYRTTTVRTRDEAIVSAYMNGKLIRDIALDHDISERRVHQILQMYEVNGQRNPVSRNSNGGLTGGVATSGGNSTREPPTCAEKL